LKSFKLRYSSSIPFVGDSPASCDTMILVWFVFILLCYENCQL
jgi:hypothetical protein